MRTKAIRVIPVVIDERQWRVLECRADLLTQVFGQPVTPHELVRDRAARPVTRRPVPGAC